MTCIRRLLLMSFFCLIYLCSLAVDCGKVEFTFTGSRQHNISGLCLQKFSPKLIEDYKRRSLA